MYLMFPTRVSLCLGFYPHVMNERYAKIYESKSWHIQSHAFNNTNMNQFVTDLSQFQ